MMAIPRAYVRVLCRYVPALLFLSILLVGLQLTLPSTARRQQQRMAALILGNIPGPSIALNTNGRGQVMQFSNASTTTILRIATNSKTATGTVQPESAKIIDVDSVNNQKFHEITSTRLDDIINVRDALMYGRPRHRKVFMAIGIPSISRKETFYLDQTIRSLIDQSSKEQRDDLILIIFLADFDADKREQIALNLIRKFNVIIQNGFLQIIKAPRDFYPTLHNLKRNFNDEMSRVMWRSKQNYDYAYLMKYSAPLAEFYMQLEDDVIAASNYLKAIQLFIKQQNAGKQPWVCLEFSRLGFIGKLFHSGDAVKLAKFLMLFYDEQPVDLLLFLFRGIRVQSNPIYFPGISLFQHMGVKSSLNNHNNTLKDHYFRAVAPIESRFLDEGAKSNVFLSASNPEATLETSLKVFGDNVLSHAYQNVTGIFWSTHGSKGDYILVKFNHTVKLKRVVIETCKLWPKEDCIEHGLVEAAKAVQTDNIGIKQRRISNFFEISQFLNGRVDATLQNPSLIDCIRIRITAEQVSWIVIREISIFT